MASPYPQGVGGYITTQFRRWITFFPAFYLKWITFFLALVDQYFPGEWITFFLTIAH